MYLQVIEHSERRHARGRWTKQRLQDGRCTRLVLLFTGQRWRLWGLRTRAQCKQSFLMEEREWESVIYYLLEDNVLFVHPTKNKNTVKWLLPCSKCWVIQPPFNPDSVLPKLPVTPNYSLLLILQIVNSSKLLFMLCIHVKQIKSIVFFSKKLIPLLSKGALNWSYMRVKTFTLTYRSE